MDADIASVWLARCKDSPAGRAPGGLSTEYASVEEIPSAACYALDEGIRMNLSTRQVIVIVNLAAIGLGACRSAATITPAYTNLGDMPVGGSAGLIRAGGDLVEFPPFGRVVARPELYHLKRIQLVGFMNLEFEGNALYHTEDEYRHAQDADAFWIDVEGMKSKPPFTRGWVIVEGLFNAERRGHMGSYAGTLERITRLDAWRLRR